jgi:hypothetical protein
MLVSLLPPSGKQFRPTDVYSSSSFVVSFHRFVRFANECVGKISLFLGHLRQLVTVEPTDCRSALRFAPCRHDMARPQVVQMEETAVRYGV